MKTIGYIASGLIMMSSISAIAQDADQNPNWRNSAEKYATQASDLTATESTTIQDTYEAYDWREAKAEEKQERQDRRYNLKTMRIQSRYNYNRPYQYGHYNQNNWNNGCGNNGWNNGFGNNGWNNNGWNNGYYGNGYNNGFNNFGYWGKPNYTNLLIGAGLGVGLYYLLH